VPRKTPERGRRTLCAGGRPAATIATSCISGGPGDDTLQHTGRGHVKMNGDDDDDLCLFHGGDEIVNCQR